MDGGGAVSAGIHHNSNRWIALRSIHPTLKDCRGHMLFTIKLREYDYTLLLGAPPKIDGFEFFRADGDGAFFRFVCEGCDDLIIARR